MRNRSPNEGKFDISYAIEEKYLDLNGSYDSSKESRLRNMNYQNFLPDSNCPEGETKTQNTQDFRKDDLGIEDINFNFSAEKAVQNFTRFDINSNFEDKNKPSELDFYNVQDENSRRWGKNSRVLSRWVF